ncbi:hypothetical protein ACSW29_22000 [Rhodococcus sp. GB-02]
MWVLVLQDGVVVDGRRDVGDFVSKEHFSASDLIALGYTPDRLTSVFGEPDSFDGETLWDRETVVAIERDVLAPAVRVLWDAFAPEWNIRIRMQGAALPLGWPQMEQMLARVTMREEAESRGEQAS